MRELRLMTLREAADAVKAGELTYEQVQVEYARRTASGIDPDTGRAPRRARAAFVAAQHADSCPTCGRATRAPIANDEVSP